METDTRPKTLQELVSRLDALDPLKAKELLREIVTGVWRARELLSPSEVLEECLDNVLDKNDLSVFHHRPFEDD